MNNPSFSPLTLIAVFAGVIEASALASLPFLSEESQTIYTWFLVGFPFFLTVLFFLTLNFNTGSLFVPEYHDPTPNSPNPAQPPTAPNQAVTSATTETQAPPTPPSAPFCESEAAMVIAISGPESRKMLERHVLRMIDRPQTTTRRWTLYNLDTRARFHLSAGPMHEDTELPFEQAEAPE
ncbi:MULTISPECIES: hypothetical protein [Pseudomonas]|uniref:hypothetical protein n=1 Tax=Pseudomonas TaxID=286 RepID=UPI001CB9C6DC|nr:MULTISPECIES: hypothetical protein [Pseudomonas]MDZ4018130.1 hypothetical protein [Pseudomonas sichuanensis]UVK84199.1 hypothetical protein LOY46_05710 [Pseudomonas sichuanensis]UVL90413.1 hypothetical protein LOY51_05810 [Pseudomonas sichuanensis]